MSLLQSSNPLLADSSLSGAAHSGVFTAPRTASVNGVINKVAGCTLVTAVAGGIGAAVCVQFPAITMIAMVVSFLVVIVSIFAVRSSPKVAAALLVIYSAAQGVAMGSVATMLEAVLASQGITVGVGLGVQAFVIVMSIVAAMLLAYKSGLLKGGATFQRGLTVLTIGILITYLASFALSFVGISLPFISIGSALQGGTAALIGLGLNVFIMLVASLWLIVDFRQVDDAVSAGAPADMEWYLAFGLMATLIWIYWEALKLVFRLALIFGDRR
jgi:uncharacterized YccA/Bax inhibitor family protein